jgi:hypothetical protein
VGPVERALTVRRPLAPERQRPAARGATKADYYERPIPSRSVSPENPKRLVSTAGRSPSFRQCRYCGDVLTRARAPLEVCASCADSPLCDRCGHPRADHTHVFTARAPRGCSRFINDFQSLSRSRCDCEGFLPIRTRLRDAAFTAPDPDPLELPLRTVDPPPRLPQSEQSTPIPTTRLAANNDAAQTTNPLLERLVEEFELDDEDEVVRLIAGVRGALAQIAAEAGGFDSA